MSEDREREEQDKEAAQCLLCQEKKRVLQNTDKEGLQSWAQGRLPVHVYTYWLSSYYEPVEGSVHLWTTCNSSFISSQDPYLDHSFKQISI